jgi:hypothetical protein
LFDEKSMATRDLLDFKPHNRLNTGKRYERDDENDSWLYNEERSEHYPPLFEFEQRTPPKLSSWCNSNMDCNLSHIHDPDSYGSTLFTPKPTKQFNQKKLSPDSAFDFKDHYIPKATEFLLDQTSVIFNSLVGKQQKQQMEQFRQQKYPPCMHSFLGHQFLPSYIPVYPPQPLPRKRRRGMRQCLKRSTVESVLEISPSSMVISPAKKRQCSI